MWLLSGALFLDWCIYLDGPGKQGYCQVVLIGTAEKQACLLKLLEIRLLESPLLIIISLRLQMVCDPLWTTAVWMVRKAVSRRKALWSSAVGR